MKRTRRKMPSIIAVALVLSTLMVLASTAFAATSANVINATPKGESIHEKIDISEITGEIAEPPELTSAASSIAKEKAWYEYVYYSDLPVAYYYLDDDTRLAFYDPYDYASSLVMEVDDSITDWSSMNTLQVSYTTSNTISETSGETTESTTSVLHGYTDTTTTDFGESTVTTTVKNRTDEYSTSKTITEEESEEKGSSWQASGGVEVDLKVVKLGGEGGKTWTSGEGTSKSTSWIQSDYVDNDKEGGGARVGYTKSEDKTTVTTSAHTDVISNYISDRITTITGSKLTSSIELSTTNSTTITKTYHAGYFNASGSPLQWKIIKYTVLMPMKYQVQHLVDDEWVFGDYSYCLLTTIQGTCRSWLQNNVAYYEHWGTGEPVTWDEFWNQFFTKENLIKAYQSKLYPEN